MEKRRMRLVAILVVFLLAVSAILGVSFAQGKKCSDKVCFDEIMESCNLGSFINEEPEASWKYQIRGVENGECSIEVTLLQAKSGDVGLREYEGSEMTCSFPVGEVALPDKDLTKCHGRLKEDLQELLIENLHAYIIDNLDEIKDNL